MTSSPGPVETELLQLLSPDFVAKSIEVEGGHLRYLDGGAGPVLLLLHGKGHASTIWLAYLTALSRHYRVIAADLPGFGQSHVNGAEVSSPSEAVEFFIGPLQSLISQLGLRSLSVIGHSLGGLMAIELALRRTVSLERLVLIGSMGLGPQMTLLSRAFFTVRAERVARWFGPGFFSRLSELPASPYSEKLTALSYELLTWPSAAKNGWLAFNRLFGLPGSAYHRRDELHSVDVPTLILHGAHDEVFPVALAKAAASLFPRAELELVDSKHSPHLERPQIVLPRIARFLAATAEQAPRTE